MVERAASASRARSAAMIALWSCAAASSHPAMEAEAARDVADSQAEKPRELRGARVAVDGAVQLMVRILDRVAVAALCSRREALLHQFELVENSIGDDTGRSGGKLPGDGDLSSASPASVSALRHGAAAGGNT